MRYLLVFLLFFISLYACSGNCIQCHPVLKESIERNHHKILKSCISCHTTMPAGMSECGGDCFSCHSQNRLIKTDLKEHQKLSTCKECHANKEDLFNTNSGINNESNILDLMENK